ncbi:MinD/ParA family ATP-binding protein [Kitasatospora sp. KL5]|uniref:MinD/ParA family ATP-binding protein n=1 Tax=Kitasatospora sp. KL5 TaxID=3425125 RepID=UPI003D700719
MAVEDGGAVVVHRLTEGSDLALGPDYGPARWPVASRRAAGDTGDVARTTLDPVAPPDWRRPLDAMGTVLVPPEERTTGAGAAPDGACTAAAVALPPAAPAAVDPVLAVRVAAAPIAARPSTVVPLPGPADATVLPGPRPGRPGPVRGRRVRRGGRSGVRGFGGFGPSGRDHGQRLAPAGAPLHAGVRIAVVGLKGGVGKTSVALALGSVLAGMRNDRVVAVDAVPGTGTLGLRIRRETSATAHDLLAAAPSITGYMDVRRFTSRTPSGLEVLAGVPGVVGARGLGPEGYRQVIDVLQRQYPIVVSDCGTGLLHDASRGVLDLADRLVVAATAGVDGASSASTTLEWLYGNGYGDLARRSVTVVSGIREAGRQVRLDDVVAHFRSRCRGVVVVPFDEHLAVGGEFDPAKLRPKTRRAHAELAAATLADADDLAPVG